MGCHESKRIWRKQHFPWHYVSAAEMKTKYSMFIKSIFRKPIFWFCMRKMFWFKMQLDRMLRRLRRCHGQNVLNFIFSFSFYLVRFIFRMILAHFSHRTKMISYCTHRIIQLHSKLWRMCDTKWELLKKVSTLNSEHGEHVKMFTLHFAFI